MTKSTLYGNHHSIIRSFPDICYLIKPFANKSAFYEHLKRGSSEFPLPDLFVNDTTLLVRGIALAEYISSFQGKWGIKISSYNTCDKDDNMVEGEDDTIKKQEKDLENDNNINN